MELDSYSQLEDDDEQLASFEPILSAFADSQRLERVVVSARNNIIENFDNSRVGPKMDREYAALTIQHAWRTFKHFKNLKRRSYCESSPQAVGFLNNYRASGNMVGQPTLAKARLVLHFDINKTIIISDAVQDANADFMVNVLLSECAWGRLVGGQNGKPAWVPVGRLATDRPLNDPTLMTYRNFLDSFALPFLEGRGAEVERENLIRKKERQELKRKFTEANEPGEMFRGIFQKLLESLKQPEQTAPHPFFPSKLHKILPSFFNLLINLQNSGRQFTVIFRTFGTDIEEIIEEINLFANGQHPLYPGIKMNSGKTDLRLEVPNSTGVFYRFNGRPDGTLLLTCASKQILEANKISREMLNNYINLNNQNISNNQNYNNDDNNNNNNNQPQLLVGFDAIHSNLKRLYQNTRQNRAYCLRDYYHFWKLRNERSKAGKLMLIDPCDNATIQIFFDDNIGHTSPHIVDARNVQAKISDGDSSLKFRETKGLNLVKVEPLNAILDPQYFVRAVNECEMSVLRRREAIEELEKTLKNDFEAFQFLRRLSVSSQLDLVQQPGQESKSSGGGARGFSSNKKVSQVARVSLRARQRWVSVCQKVRVLIRVRNILYDI